MSRARRGGTGALHLPIWPCSAWGLPCPLRCRRGGALLPHRFTLTVRSRKGTERRFLFCGTFLRVAATGCYPACCPFGVRTFLPGCPGRSRGPLGAAATLARGARSHLVCWFGQRFSSRPDVGPRLPRRHAPAWPFMEQWAVACRSVAGIARQEFHLPCSFAHASSGRRSRRRGSHKY